MLPCTPTSPASRGPAPGRRDTRGRAPRRVEHRQRRRRHHALSQSARRRVLHELWAEAHFLAYKQLSGDLLPREDGTAWHATAGVNLAKGFSFKAGYQKSHGFISLLGSPYFGSLAATDDHTLYDHAQLLYAKAQYTHRLGHVASLGIDITLYQHFSGHGLAPATGELLPSQSSASILAGIYLRVSPSLLLHRF